jgi:hypothetical protein
MAEYYFSLLLLLFSCSLHAQTVIGGIGAQLFVDSTGGHTMPRIQSLIQGAPAYDSLRATDYIISVDGNDCKDKNLETIVSWIRGAAGTSVHVVVADTKEGAHPRSYDLKRVSMQMPTPADPVAPFNAWCNEQALQLKKNGYEIIKTSASECGNYFFNFNADAGGYRVRLYTLQDKTMADIVTATVYDADNEAAAVRLTKSPVPANQQATQLDGSVTFKRDCVGVVHTGTQGDVSKCAAIYLIVYR